VRIPALVAKEFLDLARNRAALLPVVAVTVIVLALPFAIVIAVPATTGQSIGDDRDLAQVSLVAGAHTELSTEARVQLFLFQQFLLLFLLTPITGAMALAAHAIVGEKQARTLEPLLASPITTVELLVAKVLGALIPTLAISLTGLLVYFALVAIFSSAGVLSAMLTARTGLLIALVGPSAALVSLQAAIVISSRVNDARTAQQFGVLIILPLTVLAVAQFTGMLWLSAVRIAFIGLGLLGVWILLTLISVALFDREAILTRWR
jgi:ABC-2 type transport system permease protein